MSSLPSSLPKVDLTDTFGAAFIGLVFSATLYGITILQTFLYYQAYRKDRLWLKCAVAALWAVDTLDLVLISKAMYFYYVTSFGDYIALTRVYWAFKTLLIVEVGVVVSVQVLYVARLWQVSGKRSKVLPIAVSILQLAAVALGVVLCRAVYFAQTFEDFRKISLEVYLSLGSATLIDCVIGGALCVFLGRAKTGFRDSDSTIQILMVYTINTGALTGVCSLAALLAYAIAPHSFAFLAIETLVPGLYINSFIAMLNARNHIRETTGFAATTSRSATTGQSAGGAISLAQMGRSIGRAETGQAGVEEFWSTKSRSMGNIEIEVHKDVVLKA